MSKWIFGLKKKTISCTILINGCTQSCSWISIIRLYRNYDRILFWLIEHERAGEKSVLKMYVKRKKLETKLLHRLYFNFFKSKSQIQRVNGFNSCIIFKLLLLKIGNKLVERYFVFRKIKTCKIILSLILVNIRVHSRENKKKIQVRQLSTCKLAI